MIFLLTEVLMASLLYLGFSEFVIGLKIFSYMDIFLVLTFIFVTTLYASLLSFIFLW